MSVADDDTLPPLGATPSRIHLLHGIHTSRKSRRLLDLRETVERISGIETVYHEYGNLLAIQTRFWNPRIAERLAKEVKPGDILVGHSNGCCLWMRVLMLGAPAVGAVFLNPALKDDISIPPQIRFLNVYYNDDDEAVPWAQRSPHWLTDPLWGDMGRDGYKGMDERVVSVDCEHTSGLPALRGHSAIITPPNAALWAEEWARFV